MAFDNLVKPVFSFDCNAKMRRGKTGDNKTHLAPRELYTKLGPAAQNALNSDRRPQRLAQVLYNRQA